MAVTGSLEVETSKTGPHHGSQRRRSWKDLVDVENESLYEEKFKAIHKGLRLLCMDRFQSKYTGEELCKWRPIEVRVYDGSSKTTKMKIHYEGWSDAYDIWVDLIEQAFALAPLGVLSDYQIEKGLDMTQKQYEVSQLYFTSGVMPDYSPKDDHLDDLNPGGDDDDGDDGDYNQTVAGSESPETITDDITNQDSRESLKNFSLGMRLDVQDAISKGASSKSKTIPYKWRQAEITEMAGTKIRVHYVGWGNEYDEVLDIKNDRHRLKSPNTMIPLTSLKKMKTLTSGNRAMRRSFDGAPSPTNNDRMNWLEDPSTMSFMSPGSTSEVDDFSSDDPASMLRNKNAPKRKGSNSKVMRRKQASFTTKGGQVVPGAALGIASPIGRRHSSTGFESTRNASVEISFNERMENIGLYIYEVEADGNCLFRAISHQLYCNEDKHLELRKICVDHMWKYKDRFEVFCTSSFESYCQRMRMPGTWAAELEVRAMEEILDRVFTIYSSDSKEEKPSPMQMNFDEALLLGINVETVKLSYHGIHYNSIYDQKHTFPLPQRSSKKLMTARVKLLEGES